MSTTTVETNIINEKKAEEKSIPTNKTDWSGFFVNFTSSVLTIICLGVILVGSIGLYTAKVAHANILPDDINLMPYTNIERIVKERPIRPIYMNPIKIRSFFGLNFWSDPEEVYSQMAKFNNVDFLNSFSNSWLCSITEWAKPGSGIFSNFWLYESSILKQMTADTFGLMNSIFYKINYLPEWLIMLIYSFLFTIVFFIIYIFNVVKGFILHITNLFQYFRSPKNGSSSEWDDPSYFDIFNIKQIFLFFVFFFVWGFVSLISFIISPIFITIYCLLSPLSAKYTLASMDKSSTEKNKLHNFFSFLKDVVTHKNSFILLLIIYNLMTNTKKYLGIPYVYGLVIGLLILIFGLKIFESKKPTEDTTEILLKTTSLPDLSKQPDIIQGVPTLDYCNKKASTNDVIDINDVNAEQYFSGGKANNTKSNSKMKIKQYNIKLI
jgi:hypothetical protein